MAIIGTFKRSASEIIGDINTLGVSAQNVRIVKEQGPLNDDAPTHRVFAGRAEIGVGWEKTSRENRDYISLKLDDPSFPAPINANLFSDDDETFNLIWSRNRSQNAA